MNLKTYETGNTNETHFYFRSKQGYRTFCVFFNANGASVYRASLAFIFSEMIFEGGQKVL